MIKNKYKFDRKSLSKILTIAISSIFVSVILLSMTSFATDPVYTEQDCRNCHGGSTVDLHHVLYPEHGCSDCHPPPGFSVIRNCLVCHPAQNHINCMACHTPGDVNPSLFGRHADINVSDGYNNVTNNDCWTCHNQKNMNTSDIYLCESCHINNSGIVPITNESLIIQDLSHGMNNTCKNCHAGVKYHNDGTTGPLGTVEKIFNKIMG